LLVQICGKLSMLFARKTAHTVTGKGRKTLGRLCSFRTNTAGAIAIMVGLGMPVFVGGIGLGAEISFWYFTQRKLQNGADVAAYAGAARLRATTDKQEIESAALAAARKTGYRDAIGTMTLNLPATTGAFAGMPNTVEVTLKEDVPRMLSAMFLSGDVPITGRAVSRLHQNNSACILALDATASGAVTFTGSSDAVLENCNVHANSIAVDAVTVTGSADVSTPCVSAVGGVAATSGLTLTECRYPIENAEVIDDPYADVPAPSVSGPCAQENSFGGPPSATYTINPGRYCNGFDAKRTVIMNPGVYIIDGGTLRINSTALVTGTGITFYLTNGADVHLNGGATVRLSAPTSGTYKGLLFFVDRNGAYATQIFNGNSETVITGAIYAAASHIRFAGTSSVGGGCTQIVARTIQVTGDTGLGSNCSATGVEEILARQLVLLVE
jgi:hypothetical protein